MEGIRGKLLPTLKRLLLSWLVVWAGIVLVLSVVEVTLGDSDLGRLFLSGELVRPLAFGTFIVTWPAIARGLWGEEKQEDGLDLWWHR